MQRLRFWLLLGALGVIVLVVALPVLTGLLTDWWWYKEIGYSVVFSRRLATEGWLFLAVAAVGLAANLAILFALRHDHTLNARSAFLHVLSDTVSSIAIILGAGAMALRPDLHWLDPVLSLAIAALILWGAGRLVLEITHILMEAVPSHLDVAAVTRRMESADGVLAVHDLHIWTISSGMYALSAHLVVRAEAMGRNDAILTAVKCCLRDDFGIDHTTLQIESADYAHVGDVHVH